jgi:hypothetical protein
LSLDIIKIESTFIKRQIIVFVVMPTLVGPFTRMSRWTIRRSFVTDVVAMFLKIVGPPLGFLHWCACIRFSTLFFLSIIPLESNLQLNFFLENIAFFARFCTGQDVRVAMQLQPRLQLQLYLKLHLFNSINRKPLLRVGCYAILTNVFLH